ncbi:MAG: DNA polymerase Y family protein [Planctomycetales bacterium]
MQRVLSVWFPNWSVQRRQWQRPDLKARPLILYSSSGNSRRVVTACCNRARRYGIRPGLPLIEAQGIFPPEVSPKPQWEPQNLVGDREGLRQLVPLCQTFSPLVGIDHEGLTLDIDGCASLFGGEGNLLDQLAGELQKRSLKGRLAIAGTIGSAWGFSRFSSEPRTIIPPGEDFTCLAGLPLAALRLEDTVLGRFRRLGIQTVEQFLKLPRTSLPSRFGKEILTRWDQACGEVSETFTPERLTEPVATTWEHEEGLTGLSALEFVWRQLLESLLLPMIEKRLGVQELTCEYRGDFPAVSWDIRLLNPATDPQHVLGLLRLRLEKSPLGFPITRIRIEAQRLTRLAERPQTLFDTDPAASRQRDFSRLVEQLSQRLGSEAVLQARLNPDPQPEFACTVSPWVSQDRTNPAKILHSSSYRPLRMFHSPEPVRMVSVVPDGPPVRLFWKSESLGCIRWWGPERIETGWWRERDVKRDYYRVETDSGQCLWVFRDRTSEGWYLHGVFE